MSRLNFAIDGLDPLRAAALAASLPASVGMGGDALLLDGAGYWPGRLSQAITTGVRRIILIDPVAVRGLDGVIAQVEAADASVILCETHADNPAVAPFGAGLRGPFAAITITGQGMAPLAEMILAQLRLARALGIAVGDLCDAAGGADHALATLQARHGGQDLLLRLSAAQSGAGLAHHRLMAHGVADSACLEIGSETHARPATAFHITADQSVHQATIYENALRATMRRAVSGDWPGDWLGDARGLRDWAGDAGLALMIAAR